jgi:uncharacterized protein (DUF4415 family)
MKATTTLKRSVTNWAKLEKMIDKDIDYSDIPKTTPGEFARAVVKRGGVIVQPEKEQISIRLDKDMLEWFRARGKGYQREMNALLRAYMEAHQEK